LLGVDDEIFVVGKEYLPAVPLLIICDDGFSELSRTGGRGRRSDSILITGTVLPVKRINVYNDFLSSSNEKTGKKLLVGYQTWKWSPARV
jgi:hypothetical protein